MILCDTNVIIEALKGLEIKLITLNLKDFRYIEGLRLQELTQNV